ncbi:MAG: 4-amino-4-deoxy-L-arabinose transferase-like glycosyltransferase of family, partial [Chthonomonadales bacterium]|nr:4-amino-4-deoxy-L-arabinose transferase-like glycosyltransferase of family [Chthonomonadales bacterium]
MIFFTLPQRTYPQAATEESAGKPSQKSWLPALLLTLGSVLLLSLYWHRMTVGLVAPDAMDHAQLGRNLLAGHGFTTQILRPLGITDSANPLAQPDLTHGPLYPLLLALAFGIAGTKDNVVIGMSALFYLLTVPTLYALGRRLFSAQVGLLAALIFMVNGSILEYAISGTPTTLVLFLATGLVFTL